MFCLRILDLVRFILESDNAIRNKLSFKYIDLQLIRLITSNESSDNVYSKKKGRGNYRLWNLLVLF